MIVTSFKMKDIKEYENKTKESLISIIYNRPRFDTIVTLVSLGNQCNSRDEACELMDDYESQGYSLLDIITDIRKLLLGEKSVDKNADEKDLIDVSEFKTLTEMYTSFYWKLKESGLGYNEFWDMTTTELYNAIDHINAYRIQKMNDELYKIYIAAGLDGAAAWGKLPKQAPQVQLPDKSKDKKEKSKVSDLKAFALAHNARIMNMQKGGNK